MSKGHLFFAQNSDVDYLRQAYALALSIKTHNKINSTCLVTNDPVPIEYTPVFDYIQPIPWGDSANQSTWKIENRWKLIYCSPFKETLVYDSDMILLSSNDHWWYWLEDRPLALTGTVYNYKGQSIKNSSYRRTFIENNLPDVYFGLHYFKKVEKSYEFYKWLEHIVKNWELYYKLYTPNYTQKFCSMDVSSAIALKIMEDEAYGIANPLSFTHMKPAIQGWDIIPNSWQTSVIVENEEQLKLSNFVQTGVFHYTEDKFLTDELILKLEKACQEITK